MNTTELNGKQYTVSVDGEKLMLTPVVEKLKGLWKCGRHQSHYWISGAGGAVEHGTGEDKGTEKFGNTFSSEAIAEKASALMRRANIFISAALQADPDAGEWGAERKHTVDIENDGRLFDTDHHAPYACFVYVHSEDQAKHMMEILKAEGWK